jgi:hypothetical protein
MLNNPWRKTIRRTPPNVRRAALRVEALEGRDVPSSTMYGASVSAASQSYNHPDVTGTALSGQAAPFYAMAFRASADDTYTLTNVSNTYTNADTFFALYSPSFNPSNPLNNLIQVNDNFGKIGLQSQITQAVTANTTYILVTSSAASGGTGDFINQISAPGSGTITLSTHALPAVDTPTATGITTTGATLGGLVEGDGGAAVTERGIVYSITSTNGAPKIGGTGVTKVVSGSGLGAFSTGISGLTGGTTYTFRAYATNAVGTFYTSPAINFVSNAAPTIGGVTTGAQNINDTQTVAPFSGVTITDPDAPPQTDTVTITFAGANGTFTNLGSFTGGAGSYTMAGTPAAVQAAIRGLTFNPTQNQAVPGSAVSTSFTISVNDSITNVTDGQTTVNATSVNDQPTVANAIPNQVFTGFGSKSFTIASNTFADVDPGTSFTYGSTLVGGGSLPGWLSFNPLTRTFSGNPSSTSASPLQIRVTANDGKSGSVFTDFQLTLSNVNDAPVLTAGTPTLPPITSSISDASNTGQLLSTLLGSRITDGDSDDTQGVAITSLTNGGGGMWQFATLGTNWTTIPAGMSASAPLLLNADGDTRLRFVPTADATSTPSITYRAWDKTAGGGEGSLSSVDPGIGGGTSAFSTTTEQSKVGVTDTKAVTLNGIQVNDGDPQRSEVRSLTFTFSGPVDFAGGNVAAAFSLTRVGGGAVGLIASTPTLDAQGRMVVTLTFTGTAEIDSFSTLHGGAASLANGRYTLTVLGSAVTGTSNGLAVDGDNNGTAGGNYVSPTDTAAGGTGQLRLFRLFGDSTGDGFVDAFDLAKLRTAYNTSTGDGGYKSYLDANNDGGIDALDVNVLRSTINTSVF